MKQQEHSLTPKASSAANVQKLSHIQTQLKDYLTDRLWPRLTNQLLRYLPEVQPQELALLVRESLESGVQPGILKSFSKRFARAHDKDDDDIALQGDLSVISLPDVLQMLKMQRQTGCFYIQSTDQSISVYFHEGNVAQVFGQKLATEFLLGRYLILKSKISKHDLQLILQSRRSKNRLPIGEQLVRLGYIDHRDLQTALSQQSAELLYELMRWKQGEFTFTTLEPNHPVFKNIEHLQLAVDHLIMEGMRRMDEWSILQSKLPPHSLLVRPEDADLPSNVTINTNEHQLLENIRGAVPIDEVVEESTLGSFFTYKMLLRLIQFGLIEVKE